MINSKFIKRLVFMVFCLAFTLTICGAASAAPANTTHTNISTSVNQATTVVNTTTNNIKASQPKNAKGADPQIYRNGVAVARGGHPAGYKFPTIAAAISAAQSGDTIMLANGATFDEHGFSISKNLNFNVLNNGKATINAQSKGRVFIINSGTTVVMQNLIIENGSENGDGGGIENSGNLTLNDCVVKNNFANFAGAIVSWGPLTLNGCNFTDNTAYIDGGAICCSNTLIVKDCTFSNNKANGRGAGAIWNDGKSNITGSTFTNNNATGGNGGAIYNYETTLTLNGCNFTGNTATDGGGAIANSEGTLNIIGSTFTKNTANQGGATDNVGTLTVTRSTFKDNSGTNSTGFPSDGGAIYNGYTGNLIVTNTTFTNNNAGSGGAIANSEGTLTLTDNTFASNTATGGYGGAIFTYALYNYITTATLHFNRIVGNTAKYGNAIYNNVGKVDATLNWWGCNTKTSVEKQISNNNGGTVTYDPWIVLSISANPTKVIIGGHSTITADLLHDSNGTYHNPANGVVPYTGYGNFKTNKGTITNVKFVNGKAVATLTNLTTTGTATISATVDNQTVITTVKT
jgi:predicted outer membrane repeat protein